MPRNESASRCRFCGGATQETKPYPARAEQRALFRIEAIALCMDCGAGSAWPLPDEHTVGDFYANGAYWHEASSAEQRAHALNQARIRVNRLRKFLPKERGLLVADVGAGHGGIPSALARSAIATSVYSFVEPDEAAAADIARLAAPFGIRRFASLLDLPGGQDAMLLNHVIEHVVDPFSFLQAAIRRTTPGGLVYVETPNSDYRFKDDVFPHLHFFTTEAFRRLGIRLGVETILCESFGLWPAPRWSLVGMAQRLAARAFRVSVRARMRALQGPLDAMLWRYGTCADGIWLRWIFQAPTVQGKTR